MLSAVGVIPARYGSSRLPGKVLAELHGKPLLYHVYQRASRARSLQRIVIATDDHRVANVAESFGATVVMTRRDHRSGTDRIGEAVGDISADIVVNIQGDEPLIDFSSIDAVVDMLNDDTAADMSTLKTPIQRAEDVFNPNVVKVVCDASDYAIYFSRSPVPFIRNKEHEFTRLLEVSPHLINHFYRHVGLYAYRRKFLMDFVQWPPATLEILEDLEQLRAIERGGRIKVGLSHTILFGIDTPEDLDRVRELVGINPKILET